MTTPSSFPQFSHLSTEIQAIIWVFAFLLNSTFTSPAYRSALLRYTSSNAEHCQANLSNKILKFGKVQ